MSASGARLLAREVVTRVRERSAFAHEVLNSLLVSAELETRESSFASRLALGTVACRGTLDEIVRDLLDHPERLESRVLDGLAVAAYEMLYMRTPAHATVSQGVELVRSVQPKAAGLANAVLRRLAARAADFPWGDASSDIAALARLHGHPLWLADLLVGEVGFETAASVMAANNEPAPLYLALMPFRASDDAIVAELAQQGAEPQPTPLAHCIVAGCPSAAVTTDALAQGSAVVADAGAQIASACVPVSEGSRIVELGAGRGTKSLLIAARAFRLHLDVELIALDLHGFKLEQLESAVSRVAAPWIRTIVGDASDFQNEGLPEPGSADVVLVDAPCSGLGTLRRHPDRRWRAKPEEVEVLAELGARMLRTAASLVRPNGFVVYSTCTITKRENDEVIDAFLASANGVAFQNDDVGADIPHEWLRFVSSSGRFLSLPERGGPDGHFVARLVRRA